MPDKKTLRRILGTGLKTATGLLAGDLKTAQEEEERRREANEDILATLLGYARVDQSKAAAELSRARTESILEPAEDILSLSKVKGQAAQTALEAGDISVAQLLGVGTDQPKNITGQPSFDKLVDERIKTTDEQRKNQASMIINSFPQYFEDDDGNLIPRFATATPEELIEHVRASIPETTTEGKGPFGIGSLIGQTRDIVNPEFEGAKNILSQIGVTPRYEVPQGAEATALFDSTQAARQDPTIAATLKVLGGGDAGQEQVGQVPSGQPTQDEVMHGIGQLSPEEIANYDWDKLQATYPYLDIDLIKLAFAPAE